jgi:hypothetical protein
MNRDAIIKTCLFDAPRRRQAIGTWLLVLVVVSRFRPSAPTRSRRPLIERTLRPVRQRQGSQGSISLSITGRAPPVMGKVHPLPGSTFSDVRTPGRGPRERCTRSRATTGSRTALNRSAFRPGAPARSIAWCVRRNRDRPPRLRRTRPLLSFFPLRPLRRTLSIRVTAKSGRGGVGPVQAEPAFPSRRQKL